MPTEQTYYHSIAVDEVSALARRLEIIKNNSDSEIEQFVVMQTLPIISNIEQELAGMMRDPMLESMAKELVSNRTPNS